MAKQKLATRGDRSSGGNVFRDILLLARRIQKAEWCRLAPATRKRFQAEEGADCPPPDGTEAERAGCAFQRHGWLVELDRLARSAVREGVRAGYSAETVEARLASLWNAVAAIATWDTSIPKRVSSSATAKRDHLLYLSGAVEGAIQPVTRLADAVNGAVTGLRQHSEVSRCTEPARHSTDFRSVHWYGADYSFTPNQAACVRMLWEAWENGTPDVGGDTLLSEADVETRRLDHVFDNGKHSAWKTMIRSRATRGTYRLVPPLDA
jgi:hypothetical protein